MSHPRIVIVPGNGGSGSLEDLRESNFYGWAETQFKVLGLDVRCGQVNVNSSSSL